MSNAHEVKVHGSWNVSLDCFYPASTVREGPRVAIEGDLHLISECSTEEVQQLVEEN